MRSKNFLHIVTFVAAFALSTFVAGFFITPNESQFRLNLFAAKSETAVKLERFLERDVRSGYTRSVQTNQLNQLDASSIASQARVIGEYHDISSSMDADELPADFQKAWREHMRAWGNYVDFLDEQRDSSVDRDFNESDFLKADERLGREINRTWYRVLRIADRYGADVRGF